MHRITTTICLTPDELDYLADRVRPKNDANHATKTLVRSINDAARMGLARMRSDIRWVNRGPNDEAIYDVLSDTWIRSSLTGEFRMAQLHGRKGFLVHIIRNPQLAQILHSGDFVCEVNEHTELNVERMVEALENYLATGKLRAGLYRDQNYQLITI